ncbi:hypothetical protein Krac_7063 [Ktedonobacter racemifer DSM 44963]|uniref:Uncharacterized protein n=1 Tax=Ktedonobacter racemifer DSM 44963 TaxID=485913 RepID=D6TQU8_KTERA|nr:hypothetical protein Krac_7063 [Ktedonobacter racemifer DSM 44963]
MRTNPATFDANRFCIESVLYPGQSCTYEYDYGTTTELRLKVIGARDTETKGQAIRILARILRRYGCAMFVVSQPATSVLNVSLRTRAGSARNMQGATSVAKICSC